MANPLAQDKYLQDLVDLDDTISLFPRKVRLPTGAGATEATQKRFKVQGLQDYLKVIQGFPKVKMPLPGYFYSYAYAFAKTDTWSKLRLYDYHPLAFIYWMERKNGNIYAWGINFHRLPVQIRLQLLNKIFSMSGINPTSVTARKRLLWNFQRMKPLLKKLSFAVRLYRVDRMRNIRGISLRYVKQLMVFYPETLYRARVADLFSAYKTFKPTPPKRK